MTYRITACRSCDGRNLQPILSLGKTPLANSLLAAEQLNQPEQVFPLDLVLCPDCAMVQITETVPPEILFREYLYFSSFSETTLTNAEEIATRLTRNRHLNERSLVVEIASNDGYLLQYYQKACVPVLGIEPALNIASVAQERGIRTITDFFSSVLATQLVRDWIKADIIHANNVLAHVAKINDVISGIATLLKDEGLVIIEAPYVRDTIDKVEFDQIYHEHLCYFSLTSLRYLFARHGMKIVDVERLPIHGGTLRIFASKSETAKQEPSVIKLLQEEADWGVQEITSYQGFSAKVEHLRHNLLSLLRDLKLQGKRIVAYGASAKSCTLLHYFGIGRETLEYVADRSTVKQGRFTPGTHLPIVAPEKLLTDKPDYALLLTWNFADEILQQQAEYRRRGGRFIIPVPEVGVI